MTAVLDFSSPSGASLLALAEVRSIEPSQFVQFLLHIAIEIAIYAIGIALACVLICVPKVEMI